MRDAVEVPEADPKDPTLEALWSRALATWDEESAHAKLLEHAMRTDALPEIAGRYRRLVDDAAKGPLAKKRLDAIVNAATTLLFSMKTPAPGKVPLPITLSAIGVCLFLLAWLVWALFPHR
ncbi:MAG TPA: hypothetical protein VGY54_26550 [Polyangiaceae bacterium]|jgi:hypothetical protein|nr:hypothetical protein [Polyangiaceae bacterium]